MRVREVREVRVEDILAKEVVFFLFLDIGVLVSIKSVSGGRGYRCRVRNISVCGERVREIGEVGVEDILATEEVLFIGIQIAVLGVVVSGDIVVDGVGGVGNVLVI